MENTGVIN